MAKQTDNVVVLADIDTLSALGKKCRRKHREARNHPEEEKYRRMLLHLNIWLKNYQDRLLENQNTGG